MKKTRVLLGKILYNTIGQLFPSSFPLLGKTVGGLTRRLSAKLICEKCGKKTTIENGAKISSKISLGDESGIGYRAVLQGKITIGKYVMMGPDVKMYTINHKTSIIDVPMCKQGTKIEKEIIIEDDVWIGANVIILPGVTIGAGSILGAGSVIRDNIPPKAVVIGNPSKIISYRGGLI